VSLLCEERQSCNLFLKYNTIKPSKKRKIDTFIKRLGRIKSDQWLTKVATLDIFQENHFRSKHVCTSTTAVHRRTATPLGGRPLHPAVDSGGRHVGRLLGLAVGVAVRQSRPPSRATDGMPSSGLPWGASDV
jgi:hypothetical protein